MHLSVLKFYFLYGIYLKSFVCDSVESDHGETIYCTKNIILDLWYARVWKDVVWRTTNNNSDIVLIEFKSKIHSVISPMEVSHETCPNQMYSTIYRNHKLTAGRLWQLHEGAIDTMDNCIGNYSIETRGNVANLFVLLWARWPNSGRIEDNVGHHLFGNLKLSQRTAIWNRIEWSCGQSKRHRLFPSAPLFRFCFEPIHSSARFSVPFGICMRMASQQMMPNCTT